MLGPPLTYLHRKPLEFSVSVEQAEGTSSIEQQAGETASTEEQSEETASTKQQALSSRQRRQPALSSRHWAASRGDS